MMDPHASKLARDWEGRKVKTKVEMRNGYFVIPAGTIMTIKHTGPVKYLIGEPCKCCGIAPKISIAASRDACLALFEFLPPET